MKEWRVGWNGPINRSCFVCLLARTRISITCIPGSLRSLSSDWEQAITPIDNHNNNNKGSLLGFIANLLWNLRWNPTRHCTCDSLCVRMAIKAMSVSEFSVVYRDLKSREYRRPASLAFHRERALLFIADPYDHAIRCVSSIDGSLVSRFGSFGTKAGQFKYPWGVAIDHEHQRIVVVDTYNNRLQILRIDDQSLAFSVGGSSTDDVRFKYPHGAAIDERRRRILVADTTNNRVLMLSSVDGSLLGELTTTTPLNSPHGVAVDHRLDRILIADTFNDRVLVLAAPAAPATAAGGTAPNGDPPTQLFSLDDLCRPWAACVDNHSRIIVSDNEYHRLQAYTSDGCHISSIDCSPTPPWGVAFDEYRGAIAFSLNHRVHVIGANQWLPATLIWSPDLHRYAPRSIKQTVLTMTMIRSLVDESAMSMIPNELLFEIFAYLDSAPPERQPACTAMQRPPPIPSSQMAKCLVM